MGLIEQQVSDFVGKVQTAGKRLADFSRSVTERESEILQGVKQLSGLLDKHDHLAKEERGSMKKLLGDSLSHYQNLLQAWARLVEERIEGKEFINQFEKSVILAVFGTVNAGKSTMGNFIAGVPFVESPVQAPAPVPAFYVYDFSESSKDRGERPLAENRFKENIVQETSTIQYFTLENGLTWVDTPGIHSLDQEYEDLAKKYVNYADLILFVVSSSSPGKADEIAELERLTQKEKQLLVAITKSDLIESDVVDGKEVKRVVPKSIHDRQAQEQYVDGLIRSKGIDRNLKDRKFISLSSRLAKLALMEQDEERFRQSGYPALYEQIGGVLTEHALELKTDRPRREMNALIHEMMDGYEWNGKRIDGIRDIGKSFQGISEEIQQKVELLRRMHTDLFLEVRMNKEARIESELTSLGYRFDGGEAIGSEQITKVMEKELLEELNRLIPIKLGKVLADFEHVQLSSLPLFIDASFAGTYREFAYTEYTTSETTRDPRGIIERFQSFFLDKKFTELKVREMKKIKQMRIGNNLSAVMEQVFDQVEQQLEPFVKAIMEELIEAYFYEQRNTLNEVQQALKQFADKLQTLTYQKGEVRDEQLIHSH
ncbi:dynamin family protein [Brevibacillus centrosporus]|uniref:50S ribosome-binding GTPase n=1 Tax=Brevibacillus centrosporus TaxID=54910 RepID=A0A1I3SFY9_9BACL|nr:dynamin family protein [Brevibacillus centrosporus]SFJ56892.1 50S ribosome-binding GTPase [Brevibacillus centrosporus]